MAIRFADVSDVIAREAVSLSGNARLYVYETDALLSTKSECVLPHRIYSIDQYWDILKPHKAGNAPQDEALVLFTDRKDAYSWCIQHLYFSQNIRQADLELEWRVYSDPASRERVSYIALWIENPSLFFADDVSLYFLRQKNGVWLPPFWRHPLETLPCGLPMLLCGRERFAVLESKPVWKNLRPFFQVDDVLSADADLRVLEDAHFTVSLSIRFQEGDTSAASYVLLEEKDWGDLREYLQELDEAFYDDYFFAEVEGQKRWILVRGALPFGIPLERTRLEYLFVPSNVRIYPPQRKLLQLLGGIQRDKINVILPKQQRMIRFNHHFKPLRRWVFYSVSTTQEDLNPLQSLSAYRLRPLSSYRDFYPKVPRRNNRRERVSGQSPEQSDQQKKKSVERIDRTIHSQQKLQELGALVVQEKGRLESWERLLSAIPSDHKEYIPVLTEVVLLSGRYSLFRNTAYDSFFSLPASLDRAFLLSLQTRLKQVPLHSVPIKIWWLMHRYFFTMTSDKRLLEKKREAVLALLTDRGLRLQDFPSVIFSSLQYQEQPRDSDRHRNRLSYGFTFLQAYTETRLGEFMKLVLLSYAARFNLRDVEGGEIAILNPNELLNEYPRVRGYIQGAKPRAEERLEQKIFDYLCFRRYQSFDSLLDDSFSRWFPQGAVEEPLIDDMKSLVDNQDWQLLEECLCRLLNETVDEKRSLRLFYRATSYCLRLPNPGSFTEQFRALFQREAGEDRFYYYLRKLLCIRYLVYLEEFQRAEADVQQVLTGLKEERFCGLDFVDLAIAILEIVQLFPRDDRENLNQAVYALLHHSITEDDFHPVYWFELARLLFESLCFDSKFKARQFASFLNQQEALLRRDILNC